ncbi:hypothetical protein Igni_0656 [Ignicoccus hospitalis KIN4/I]|uniref:Uncharacterized protein n=1 Tax=Ignicoccus hospitalis (strain KIN4/I / DSM 18386 / JCM 14125) TaxID=453591 RepID=A8AA86_IGNH4|nr:hypothetical protein Igni_0656 [Ignicoccus hospitalis KIN4/I]
MFVAAMIGVAVAAVVGVGVGLYLCKRSLKVVKE